MSNAAKSAGPAEHAPLRGAQLAIGAVALSLATFMNVLDTSIANVSIPAISGDLGVSPDQGTWVITSFGVANAISLPLTGWMTRRYGQVRLFTWSLALFVAASFLCALAPTIWILILARGLQGIGGGGLLPIAQTIIADIVSPRERGRDADRRRPARRACRHRQEFWRDWSKSSFYHPRSMPTSPE